MFNIRKFFRLAPYNRPYATLEDLRGTYRTIAITTPAYTVNSTTDGKWAIYDAGGEAIRTYTTKANATRGLNRLTNVVG